MTYVIKDVLVKLGVPLGANVYCDKYILSATFTTKLKPIAYRRPTRKEFYVSDNGSVRDGTYLGIMYYGKRIVLGEHDTFSYCLEE